MKRKIFPCFLFFLLLSTPLLAAGNRVDVPLGSSPTKGPANAPVTMFVFVDFQ